MTHDDLKSAVVRFAITVAFAAAVVFGWLTLVSYDPADSPGTTVYPASATVSNVCGAIGAWLAHAGLYYFGYGVYALLLLLTVGFVAYCRVGRIGGLWLRFAGAVCVIAAVGALAAMLVPAGDGLPMNGPGGAVGLALNAVLAPQLGEFGGALALVTLLLIGLLLAADELVVRSAQQAGAAAKQTAPILVGAGARLSAAVGAASNGARNGNGPHPRSVRAKSAKSGKARSSSPADEDTLFVNSGADDGGEVEADEAAVATADGGDDDEYEYEYVEEDGDGDAGETEATAEGDDEAYEYEYEEEDGEATEDELETDEDALPEPPPIHAAGTSAAASAAAAKLDLNALFGRREAAAAEPHQPPDDRGYQLPSIAMLEDAPPVDRADIERGCRDKAAILEQTLQEFRLEVQVVAIETGPVITVFELKLAAGIKVSQINSLTNDMARALKAPAVRVVAPLPGKNTIGIEVPNIDKEKVRIKDIIVSAGAKLAKADLPLFLGKDASGAPLVADLTRMPHLLVAGTTGSGKSVCISSIVMSFLLTRTPSEVQLILVDPKVVELTMFKDVPHLMCPIVTDMGRASAILEWASTKMDERYALLAEAGVKDIRSYNKLGEAGLRERFNPTDEEEFARIPRRLPYMVLIIDELADMMMTSAKEVEFHLVRIAQKSRAVGIHLIVSTQRPSANVVTGLIKSNLPSRIAFRVASRLDSRIVLDQNGGEVLMGQGDMLFLPPGQSKLVRAQGTFIDDEELRSTVKHAASQCEQSFHPELTRNPAMEGELDERDELFDQAVDIIVASGRGSVSLLQRKLTIGYGRASRLIEQMYVSGLVGEYKGSQAREVLVTKDEWAALKAQRDREEGEG